MQIDTKYSYILHATPEDNNFIFWISLSFVSCALFNSILSKQYNIRKFLLTSADISKKYFYSDGLSAITVYCYE